MILKYFLILFIAAFYLLTYQNSSSYRKVANEGIFPDIEKLDENHQLNGSEITINDIEEFIKLTSYDDHLCNDHYRGETKQFDNPVMANVLTANQLATEIYNLSQCFNFDPGIFASLIFSESQFCNFGGKISQNKSPIRTALPRKSATNAVGLTMFTTIGKTEIDHQLFVDDKQLFHYEARPKIHQMMAKCQYASTHSFTASEYFKYKTYINDPIYQSQKLTMDQLKDPKKWKQQLLYSAIKIKILLSKTKQPDEFDDTQNSALHYYNMLRDYNGAGGIQESEYWQLILSMYQDVFNPNFKLNSDHEKIIYKSDRWDRVKKNLKSKFDNSVDQKSIIYQRIMD